MHTSLTVHSLGFDKCMYPSHMDFYQLPRDFLLALSQQFLYFLPIAPRGKYCSDFPTDFYSLVLEFHIQGLIGHVLLYKTSPVSMML